MKFALPMSQPLNTAAATARPRHVVPPALRLLLLLTALVFAVTVDFSGFTRTEAQTATTFVKNTGQTGSAANATLDSTFPAHGQGFVTGSVEGGYRLTSIGIYFATVGETNAAAKIVVSLRETSGGNPGTTICTLTDPASISADSVNEFSVPSTCDLVEDATTYFVVIERTDLSGGSIELQGTAATADDAGAATGWSIGDKAHLILNGSWTAIDGAVRIEVKGHPKLPATGQPRVRVSAEGPGVLFADTSSIADANGLPESGAVIYVPWVYSWTRVDGNNETEVGNSQNYLLVDADVGKRIKVTVSFKDADGFDEVLTSGAYGPIRAPGKRDALSPPSTLISNTGQARTVGTITDTYALRFRLGSHGQGYEISSVLIDLAERPDSLKVSLYIAGLTGLPHGGIRQYKLFDFKNPDSFKVGLNRFTAPAWAFAYQKINYYIVLSDFGDSLRINETSSDLENRGGEPGAWLADTVGSRSNVLRLSVEGSRRERGLLASNYAQDPDSDPDTIGVQYDQENISVGDEYAWRIVVGAADRYLIRGFSLYDDDTLGSGNGGFINRYDLKDGSTDLFSLHNSRDVKGISLWSAPQGATVAGNGTYDFDQKLEDKTDQSAGQRRGAILKRVFSPPMGSGEDAPTAAGVTLSIKSGGDVNLDDTPYMAVIGEPLHSMISNLGQTALGFVAIRANEAAAQGFSTASADFGYRLQGIGVNLVGTSANVPEGPSSVSLAVYSDANGKPGRKLFDLISPDEYGPDHNFFEAPSGVTLLPDTAYVLVWRHLSGQSHWLRRTQTDNEDSGGLAGFEIGDSFSSGPAAQLNGLTAHADGDSLQIAVYGEALVRSPHVLGDHRKVSRDWLHIPDQAYPSYQFRVVFVTHHGIAATSRNFVDYDALVQREARASYSNRAIRNASWQFKALVCTANSDARTRAGMTDTGGVPIHWLDGGWENRPTLIANLHGQFYGANWTNSDSGAYVTGNTAFFDKSNHGTTDGGKRDGSHMIWTGCQADGTAHPENPMGSGTVAVGTPRSSTANFGPLGAVDRTAGFVTDKASGLKQIYAISPIFEVSGGRSPHAYWSTTMTVGTYTTGTTTVQELFGYGIQAFGAAFGSISESGTFSVGAAGNSVGSVRTHRQTVAGVLGFDRVALSLTSPLPAAFIPYLALELDGTRFLLSEASQSTITAGVEYRWDNPGLVWAEDDTVAVELIDLRN